IDDRTHRSIAGSYDLIISNHGAQPMREVDDFRSRDTWEEILVTPGKPYNFMRKDRPADHNVIVIENEFIQGDWHVLCHQSSGDLCHFGSRDYSQTHEIRRILP